MPFRSRFMAWLVMVALGGCSLPAPYQTYSPGTVPAPTPPQNPIAVYGATTTTPDNQIDFGDQNSLQGSAFTPAPTPAPQTASQNVAICYSRLWNSAEAVRSAAVQACGNKGTPRVVDQGTDLNACPLMTPTQAVFACSAGP